MNEKIIQTYQEFWPFYLKQHSRLGTRILHTVGLLVGLLIAAFAIYSRARGLFPLALAVGYAFAWISHAFIEHNRPATFQYPFWSFISDFRMAYRLLTGHRN